MPTDPRPDLVERFNRGDDDVVESLYRAYEPYLRAVVRRMLSGRLRSQFDSVDVVQSVWVHVVQQFGEDGWNVGNEDQLRSLLATIARRRLIGRVRRQAAEAPATGEGLAPDLAVSRHPRPSEMAQSDDLWEALLRICPPEHHDVLRLRRQGLRLTDIAARTGLHEGSVRRIIRQLSRELAMRNRAAPGFLSGE